MLQFVLVLVWFLEGTFEEKLVQFFAMKCS